MIVVPSETDIALLCAYLAFLPFAVIYLTGLAFTLWRCRRRTAS